jgi:hypothetical protein
MPDSRLPETRSLRPGRLLWILGLAVGIVAGGFVAIGLVNSVPARIGSQG